MLWAAHFREHFRERVRGSDFAVRVLCAFLSITRMHTKGVMQPHATLRRVLRRFSNSKCFLEGFFEGACKGFGKDKVLRRVLRIEGA